MNGVVVEAPSGDTLTIASTPKLGAPQKRITLSSLIAPKLVSRVLLTLFLREKERNFTGQRLRFAILICDLERGDRTDLAS